FDCTFTTFDCGICVPLPSGFSVRNADVMSPKKQRPAICTSSTLSGSSGWSQSTSSGAIDSTTGARTPIPVESTHVSCTGATSSASSVSSCCSSKYLLSSPNPYVAMTHTVTSPPHRFVWLKSTVRLIWFSFVTTTSGSLNGIVASTTPSPSSSNLNTTSYVTDLPARHSGAVVPQNCGHTAPSPVVGIGNRKPLICRFAGPRNGSSLPLMS